VSFWCWCIDKKERKKKATNTHSLNGNSYQDCKSRLQKPLLAVEEWECEKLLTVEDSSVELRALSPAMTIETEFERERES